MNFSGCFPMCICICKCRSLKSFKKGYSLITKTLSVKAASTLEWICLWRHIYNSNNHLPCCSTRGICVLASQMIFILAKFIQLMKCVHRLHYDGETYYTQSWALTVIFVFKSYNHDLSCIAEIVKHFQHKMNWEHKGNYQ